MHFRLDCSAVNIMGISDLIIYDGDRTFSTNYCEASKDIPKKAFEKKECGCYKTLRVH